MAGCTRRTVTLYELHPPHASPCCRRHLHQVIPLVGGTRRTQCLTATATRHGRRRGSLYLQQLAPTAGSPCHMRIRGGLHRPYGGAAGRVQPAAHAQAWRAAPAAGGSCCGSNPPRLRDPSLGYTCSRCAAQRAVVRARTVGVQHSSTRGILQPAGGEELFLVKPKSKLLSSVLNLVLRSVYGRISHAPRVPRLLAPKRL